MTSLKRILITALFLLPCSSFADISGAGSSAAKPLYTKWAEYYAQTGGAKLNYQPVGSSAGLKQIKEKAVDFGASDVAPPPDDLKRDKLICFPSAISGVVPVINLPGIKSGEIILNGEVLADIFAHKITKWNDPAIAALNQGVGLPKSTIITVVRQDGSGTTYNFTDYLSKVSPNWKTSFGRNFTITWPADSVAVKGSGSIVSTVKQTSSSIGYIDYNYVTQEKLTYVRMLNRDGKVVAPKAEAFAAALNNSSWKNANFEDMLTDKPGPNTWPITMGTFVLLPQVATDPDKTIAALKFFTWSFIKGDAIVGDLDFVRLPDRVQARIYNELTKITDASGKPLNWGMQKL